MAKQEVIDLGVGSTLIYQKVSNFDGYSFVIGFKSGSKLDGRYKGLSHLLEHLLFRQTDSDLTKNILDNILRYTINQNAFTSKDYICMDFSAVKSNVELVLENCMKMMMNRHFTNEQIADEIEIVKQEISLQEPVALTAFDVFLNELQKTQSNANIDILGNGRTLAKITPEILTEYVDRYFNQQNLVISVTSNKSLEEVINLCNDYIVSKVPVAKDPRYIVGYPKEIEYKPFNLLIAQPIPDVPTVSLSLLLRERMERSRDIDKEFAFDIIESYIMNTLGGLMWHALRVNKHLTYSYGLDSLDLGSTKFKVFNATTTKNKLNETTREMCKLIKDISENGVSEEIFNTVKTTILEQTNATLNKFRRTSASSNFQSWFEGSEFVDYKKVMTYTKNMTYEDFNSVIKRIYSSGNVSVIAEGDFESRKFYNLVEIEKMLGNYRNAKYEAELNTPRIEATPIDEQTEIDLSTLLSYMGMQPDENVDEEEKEEPAVTIEDEPVDL